MSRIVLASSGSFGDLHPYLAVGLGLKARGHEVIIATSESYREKVTGEGLGFHRMRPDLAPMTSSPEAVRRAFDPHTGSAYYVKELVLPYVEETHRDLIAVCKDADILLIHPTLFTAPLVAERFNLKWLSVLLAPGTFISAYDPPLMPPVPWLHTLRFLGPTPQRLMFRTMKAFTKSWGAGVDRIREREGLKFVSRCVVLDDLFSPYGILGWFSGILGERQADWPEPNRITGFVFYDRHTPGQRLTQELDAFLGAGASPVVFTLGSSAVVDAGDFFEQSLEAVRKIGCRAVFLVGDQGRKDEASVDGTVFVTAYAPYSELFPRCAAVVHQGGIGTLACALHAGVPSLIVPRGLDQPDNAFRAERIGVARVLPRRRYNAARAESHLRALLDSPHYAVKAQAAAERVRRENGVENACDAIEEVLRQPKLDARD